MKDYRLPKTFGWHQEHEDLARVFAQWGVTDWEAIPNVMLSRANSLQVTRQERAVTVRFVKDGREVRHVMDRYETATQNLKALTLCLDDLRMLDRRGLSDIAASVYMQLDAPKRDRDPYEVLGLRPGASAEDIEAMYRVRAKQAHPDVGGSDEAMAELNAARDRLLAVVR